MLNDETGNNGSPWPPQLTGGKSDGLTEETVSGREVSVYVRGSLSNVRYEEEQRNTAATGGSWSSQERFAFFFEARRH